MGGTVPKRVDVSDAAVAAAVSAFRPSTVAAATTAPPMALHSQYRRWPAEEPLFSDTRRRPTHHHDERETVTVFVVLWAQT